MTLWGGRFEQETDRLLRQFGDSIPFDRRMYAADIHGSIAYAAALAKDAGNVLAVNMVLLGALIQTGVLPLTVDNVKEAMKRKTKQQFLDSNLKAFELGYSAAEKAA